MGKSLLIVESPAKAKTINKFLGNDYIVMPTGGHIIDLPPDDFAIDIENNFEPKYDVIKGKKRILQDLKKAAKGADEVLLATDPDREGEAIAWHVAQRIVGKDQPQHRVLINQITRDAVKRAVEEKGDLVINKVYAQQARRVLDRLVGYKVSPVLWSTIYKGLSAGRVQSVALRLIVERDGEIDAFTAEEYWKIAVEMATGKKEKFEAKLMKKDGKAIAISSSEDSEKIISELEKLDFAVSKVQKKKTKRNPTPSFITSTLQQAAARRMGFGVARTMRVAQSLYEGVEIGATATGLITYMRTDSTRIAPEALDEARAFIAEKWGEEHLPTKPNIYRAKKSAQDAHEAIRPASLKYPPDKIKQYLNPDQLKLYTMIWNKFVSSQMKPAEYTVVTVDIAAGSYDLRSSARQLDYMGYLTVFEEMKPENADEENEAAELPKMSKDDALDLKETMPTQHFTKPPAAFTEASLVRELESLGIGRPSTYAQIINTIMTRKYVDREKGRLKSTELGRNVNKILVGNLDSVFNVDFTANMEDELDKVEAGTSDWVTVVRDFYEPFSKSLEELMGRRKELKESLIEKTEEVCEKCGSEMIIRWGRNGRFMACSGFPGCKNTKPLEEQEKVTTDEVCEKCGSAMEVKTGRYGRFLACSGYPECKNIKPFTMGVKCPEEDCKGDLVEKKSKKGRIFYGCSKYPECKFASWDKPIDKKCPSCDSPTVTESKNGDTYTCPRCKTKFEPDEAE